MNNLYPPGPKSKSPVGIIRAMRDKRLDFLVENRQLYGDFVHFQIGSRHFYQLNNPESIQYVLVKYPEKFQKSPTLKKTTRQSIGQGLLTSDGDLHKRQRRLVQPAFHHNRIAAYADVMVDYTTDMLHEWQTGNELDMAQEMMRLTMRIVSKTLFDADVSDEADSIGAAITVGIETTSQRVVQPIHLPDWLPTPKNRERRRSAEIVDSTVMGMINERRAAGEDKGDLLSMLLLAVDDDDGGTMTNQQVHDEAMTLFIAGHETTANALAWTLYLLSQNPDAEARLVAELDHVLNGRTPTMADLPKLIYTDQVVKESMRLYPPAYIVSRQAMEAIELEGYVIPNNSIVLLSPYVLHHDARFFPEPERFLPERFAPGYEKNLPKYAYFPFGGGPRVCIGNQFAMMEANLILATIVQKYHLSLLKGQSVQINPVITLRPTGLRMAVAARETAVLSPELSLAEANN